MICCRCAATAAIQSPGGCWYCSACGKCRYCPRTADQLVAHPYTPGVRVCPCVVDVIRMHEKSNRIKDLKSERDISRIYPSYKAKER